MMNTATTVDIVLRPAVLGWLCSVEVTARVYAGSPARGAYLGLAALAQLGEHAPAPLLASLHNEEVRRLFAEEVAEQCVAAYTRHCGRLHADLVASLRRLADCPDVNLDELEPETEAARDEAWFLLACHDRPEPTP